MRKISVFLFIFISVASGWLGFLIDQFLEPQPEGNSLGMGLWLILPFLTAIILQFIFKDNWKDIGLKLDFQENIKWYFISIIIFPIIVILTLAIGKVFGHIYFTNFKIDTYLMGIGNLMTLNFIKNIFEELAWRGYLTKKLVQLQVKEIWLYLVAGGT